MAFARKRPFAPLPFPGLDLSMCFRGRVPGFGIKMSLRRGRRRRRQADMFHRNRITRRSDSNDTRTSVFLPRPLARPLLPPVRMCYVSARRDSETARMAMRARGKRRIRIDIHTWSRNDKPEAARCVGRILVSRDIDRMHSRAVEIRDDSTDLARALARPFFDPDPISFPLARAVTAFHISSDYCNFRTISCCLK